MSTSSATNNAGQQASRFRQLSAPRQALVRLFQTINFGRIEDLEIRRGEPAFNPAPLVLLDLKLDTDEGPRPEHALTDFVLCDEVRRLMARLSVTFEQSESHRRASAANESVLIPAAKRLQPKNNVK